MNRRWRRGGVVLGTAVVAALASQSAGYSEAYQSELLGSAKDTRNEVLTYAPTSTAPTSSGSWKVLPYGTTSLAVHSTVLPGGKVLLTTGSGNDEGAFAAGSFRTSVWDPVAGTFQTVLTPADVFCGGQASLADGNVLVVGGTLAYQTATQPFKGIRNAYVFNRTTLQYEPIADMNEARWYPTAVETGSGDVLVAAGLDENGKPSDRNEVFFAASRTWHAVSPHAFPTYPHLLLLKDGRFFYSGINGLGEASSAGIYDPFGGTPFVPVTGLNAPTKRIDGATVLLPPAQNQKVLAMGGADLDNNAANKSTFVVDTDSAKPIYTSGVALPAAKVFVSAVILPDSTVFETGGATSFYGAPVQEASIYNPTTGLFTSMNAPTVPRVYHSEAFLLPDGRVATVGGNPGGANPVENRIEVFSPPYLLKGERPTISQVATEMHYGNSYPVFAKAASGSSLSSFVLVRPSATTHQDDPNQRLVKVGFASSSLGGTLTLNFGSNMAPPGYYMLFAVDSQGRPSVASWVHLT